MDRNEQVQTFYRSWQINCMTYSTIVSMESVIILLIISALNDLKIVVADIHNAFLSAPKFEKH